MPSSVEALDRVRRGVGVRLDVPVRASRYTVLLHAFFAAAGVVVSVVLTLSLAGVLGTSEDVPRPPVAARAALLTAIVLATLFMAWRLAWNLRGREIYAREGSKLTIRREIGGVGRTRAFEWGRVRNLRVGSFKDQPVAYATWGRPFVGKGDGYIEFEYEGTTHFYGRGLDTEEARKVVSALGHPEAG